MAANYFQVPVALISLIAQDRQWFKSHFGVPICETGLDVSFCAYAILDDACLVVPNATLDSRFCNNPLVVEAPGVRFYAGAPLTLDTDIRLGTFCIIDTKPRPAGLTSDEESFLKDLAALTVEFLNRRLDKDLFEANPAPILIYDSTTLQFLTGNIAAERLYGYSGEEFREMRVTDLRDEDESLKVREYLRKNVDFEQSGPWKHRTKYGEELLVLITSRRTFYGGRDVRMAIVTDVTEITRAQERLREALESANTALNAKSQFLATMSHEFRTPMNHILGMSSLLLDTEMTETQRECAKTICTSGESLEAMLGDILDYSTLDFGGETRASVLFEPARLISEAAATVSDGAQQKGLQLSCTVKPDVPRSVRGDARHIHRILQNLLGNAVKFTSAGSVAIIASAVQKTDNKIELRFLVSDTGVGISSEAAAKLFQPFTPGDSSNTRCYGGCGLGLAICKKFTEQLGGSIGFSSTVGLGSQFWFTVPLEIG